MDYATILTMIKNSSPNCTKIIPKPYMPMNELPRWAYTKSEWSDVEFQTMAIVNDVRMVYDYNEWKRQKYKNQNSSMAKLGLI